MGKGRFDLAPVIHNALVLLCKILTVKNEFMIKIFYFVLFL